MTLAVLADRTLTAEDGAGGVVGGTATRARKGDSVTGFAVTYVTTGSPATINVRTLVEGSRDGFTWFQAQRFVDQTNVAGATLFSHAPGTGTGNAGFAPTASDIDTLAGSSVQADYTFNFYRARTKLQTLTGGTAPTVRIIVSSLD